MAKRKVWITLGIITALLLIILLGRNWIRQTASPAIARWIYKSSVDSAFRKSFDPIDKHLQNHGIVFRGGTTAEAVCANTGYDAWMMTNSCDIIQQSNSTDLDDSYIKEWRQNAPALEDYLLTQGWEKTWDERQSIATLFDDKNIKTPVAVNYKKERTGTVCVFSIVYTGNLDPNTFYANRECHRTATFFGL